MAGVLGFILLAGLGWVAWTFYGSVTAPDPSKSAVIAVGNMATVPTNAILCPDVASLTLFFESLAKADAAKDNVGAREALQAAISMGCYTGTSPMQAKAIDLSGFSPQFVRLRLPDTSAVWAAADEISPAPSTPSNSN